MMIEPGTQDFGSFSVLSPMPSQLSYLDKC